MSAPSFSSFPPSFSSFPDLDPTPSKEREAGSSRKETQREGKKRREETSSKHRHRDKGDKKERKREKERHKSRHGNDQPQDEGTKDRRDTEPSASEHRFFYSDRKGDRMNIQYGGLHAGDVPKYHVLGGSRNVLGLPGSFVIYRRAGKGVEIGRSIHRKMTGLTEPGSRALLAKPPTRLLMPSASNSKYEERDGYIALPSRKGRGTAEDTYRSITEKDRHDDSDSSSSSDADDDASTNEDEDGVTLTAHQETLRSLEQSLTADPSAVDKWLALLNQTLSTIPLTSKNATQARCEITVSILTRALSSAPENGRNKLLRVLYLKAGEEIWHESKLRAEWEDALVEDGIEIMMEWLEWRIRKAQDGLDSVISSATRIFDRLGESEDAEVGKVRVFWRVAVAIKAAGYSERAMAMFQAQAELAFYPPPTVSQLAFRARLPELEDFWDAEVPRIGEEGAKGWRSWYTSKADQKHHPIPPPSPVAPDLDPYRQWAAQESLLDGTISLPTRSDSDTTDPYSTILFADIQPLMINISSQRAKAAFRLAWLSFLGMHLPGFSLAASPDLDWDDRWNLEHLATSAYMNSLFPSESGQMKLLTDAVAGVVIGRERDYASPFGPVRCWGRDVSGPLDISSAEPGKTLKRGVWTSRDMSLVDENIARRLFSSLRVSQIDTEWDTLFLAFEVAINPKNAAKASKSLLATQSSLPLWGAHAQLERLRGRLDDARKVYQTVLIASRPKNTEQVVALLWWNWAEMEWLAGGEQQALNVVLKSVGMEGAGSGVTLLRAKRSLEDLGSSPSAKEREPWIKLRALLELLTGHQPEMALEVFDRFASSESLETSALLMVYYYGFVLRQPMPPSILRDRAHAAFDRYPSNSIILGMLLEAEKGQGVWGRVRAMLGNNDGKAKGVARRIEEIWIARWEQGRWLSEVERTRNGLAAAVEHERTRSSPVIWRIYIEFEIRVGELQRAKKLVFRAIGECPLVKGLYLLAFGPLRSVFGTHELNGLADTMVERGLRLHQGLDEVVEGGDLARERDEEGGSEDEIEHNARELRRLMPY